MRLLTTIILLLTLTMATSSQKPRKTMPKYYCEYCGLSFSDVRQLTGLNCHRHPNGANRGKHKLYEGSEKPLPLLRHTVLHHHADDWPQMFPSSQRSQ